VTVTTSKRRTTPKSAEKKAAAKKHAPRKSASSRAAAAPTLLDVSVRNAVAIVVLNRPDVHNAFDETLIAELTATLAALDRDDDVRAVVIAGAGKSLCAGADLNWM